MEHRGQHRRDEQKARGQRHRQVRFAPRTMHQTVAEQGENDAVEQAQGPRPGHIARTGAQPLKGLVEAHPADARQVHVSGLWMKNRESGVCAYDDSR